MRIVFELENVLCNVNKTTNNIKFIMPSIKMLKYLTNKSNTIEIWTEKKVGYNQEFKNHLVNCLFDYNIGVNYIYPSKDFMIDRLFMRRNEDNRSSSELKLSWLNSIKDSFQTVDLAFESNENDVNMWKEQGISCFQIR